METIFTSTELRRIDIGKDKTYFIILITENIIEKEVKWIRI